MILRRNIITNDLHCYVSFQIIERRKLWKAYLFWLFTGIFGGHYFYCFQYDAGILFALTLGGLIIGWIADIFFIPILVFQVNQIIDRINQDELQRLGPIGNDTILTTNDNIRNCAYIIQEKQTADDGKANQYA